ncbi:hypothetical protein C8R44DRAFT_871500 [Mycena epipterygia]|nr:hypothetical protein C8R44DRAFT_871500 [Mycena epipterygia]
MNLPCEYVAAVDSNEYNSSPQTTESHEPVFHSPSSSTRSHASSAFMPPPSWKSPSPCLNRSSNRDGSDAPPLPYTGPPPPDRRPRYAGAPYPDLALSHQSGSTDMQPASAYRFYYAPPHLASGPCQPSEPQWQYLPGYPILPRISQTTPRRQEFAYAPLQGEQTLETYHIVPRTYAGLVDWAYIAKNRGERDQTRGLMLLYKKPRLLKNSPGGLLCPVGIRVQGFVERCNLKPLGAWSTGKPPQSTIQHIVLSGGANHSAVFHEYKDAVDGVVKFIHRTLGVAAPATSSRDDPDSMFISRRVFSKVTAHNRNFASALELGDDPTDSCASIESEWRVLKKLSIGMYMRDEVDPMDGVAIPCDPLVICQGDFVDVCLGFDIVSKYAYNGELNVQVHLNIQHVLLLASGNNLRTETPAEDIVIIQEPGLSF